MILGKRGKGKMAVYNKNKMMKMMREALGITQKELVGVIECENQDEMKAWQGKVDMKQKICSEQTLSRMENGTQRMNPKTVSLLMNRMGVDIGNSYTAWSLKEFELSGKKRELEECICQEDYKNAKKLLNELRKRLLEQENKDTDAWKKNNQYFRFMELVLEYKKGQVDAREYATQLEKILKLSVCDYKIIENKKWPYRLNELYILLNMHKGYRECMETSKAIQIMKNIQAILECDYMMGEDVERFKCWLRFEIVKLIEMTENYEDVEDVAMNGISDSAQCGMGTLIHQFLYEIVWSKEQQNKGREMILKVREECLEKLGQAYVLAGMMGLIKKQEFYEKHAKEYYGVSLKKM